MTSGLQSQDGVVGMKFASLVDGTHRVTELEPGGAAWSSGLIRIGDQILMVEGMRTSYVDKKRVEQAFRGRPGSFLTVEMQRGHKTFPVLLQRVERARTGWRDGSSGEKSRGTLDEDGELKRVRDQPVSVLLRLKEDKVKLTPSHVLLQLLSRDISSAIGCQHERLEISQVPTSEDEFELKLSPPPSQSASDSRSPKDLAAEVVMQASVFDKGSLLRRSQAGGDVIFARLHLPPSRNPSFSEPPPSFPPFGSMGSAAAVTNLFSIPAPVTPSPPAPAPAPVLAPPASAPAPIQPSSFLRIGDEDSSFANVNPSEREEREEERKDSVLEGGGDNQSREQEEMRQPRQEEVRQQRQQPLVSLSSLDLLTGWLPLSLFQAYDKTAPQGKLGGVDSAIKMKRKRDWTRVEASKEASKAIRALASRGFQILLVGVGGKEEAEEALGAVVRSGLVSSHGPVGNDDVIFVEREEEKVLVLEQLGGLVAVIDDDLLVLQQCIDKLSFGVMTMLKDGEESEREKGMRLKLLCEQNDLFVQETSKHVILLMERIQEAKRAAEQNPPHPLTSSPSSSSELERECKRLAEGIAGCYKRRAHSLLLVEEQIIENFLLEDKVSSSWDKICKTMGVAEEALELYSSSVTVGEGLASYPPFKGGSRQPDLPFFPLDEDPRYARKDVWLKSCSFGTPSSSTSCGVGLHFGRRGPGEKLLVLKLEYGSPSFFSRLVRVDDEILSIDGCRAEDLKVEEVEEKLRGKSGTLVFLKLFRPRAARLLYVSLMRQQTPMNLRGSRGRVVVPLPLLFSPLSQLVTLRVGRVSNVPFFTAAVEQVYLRVTVRPEGTEATAGDEKRFLHLLSNGQDSTDSKQLQFSCPSANTHVTVELLADKSRGDSSVSLLLGGFSVRVSDLMSMGGSKEFPLFDRDLARVRGGNGEETLVILSVLQ
ncbi:hypothetical protein GUITHDRAFT_103422 [Guillardia theta CCMP2712]|uniref:PDZ domain-containing protein n=1 Tax=Guillardia theta (strain CCMP2712) TaxID=905079 RepID=L1JQX5_GUITC|nr:hypothetical protein GUITHDRAFT_103422 [Guillardia theta CCMP2712]EKX50832.1 hypothetical protein GUITHDRAFT_103422 [Guillardia theta CCMP2712]|eukprot:XP_005837812.1 hypothetical protein GUITHDRAFT_103422 [Guillardia theta CCMP2712]